ncbi:MAG: mechanosensitive ion channel [Methylococcaceae bacterium]|nr:mechanosensitive ion channel [Methylococcaceae bacterium]
MKKIDCPAVHLQNNSNIHGLLIVVFVIILGVTHVSTVAFGSEQKSSLINMSKNALQMKIEAINARQGMDEAFKSKLLKFYQSAQDNLNNIDRFKTQEADYKQAIKQAPEKIKKLQKEIELLQSKLAKQTLEDFSRIPTEELDQRLIIEKGRISSLDEQLKKLESDLTLQSSRPQLIRQEILIAQQELESQHKKLETQPTGSNTQQEIEARQTYRKTLTDSRTVELETLEVEAISNPARVELLKTRVQLLDLQKNSLVLTINSIETLLAERHQQEAKDMQDALTQAEKELSGKHPLIQSITRKNIQYSKDLQSITGNIEYYNEQKAKLDALISQIDNDYKSAEKKISLAGLSPALGKILHIQRRNLLAQDPFTIQSETVQAETASTSLEQFKIDDELKHLMDIDSELKEMMRLQVASNLSVEQRMMVQAEVRILINNQKELLNKLSMAYTTYLRILGDFDFASQQLVNLKEKFTSYLDEKLLWVKSSEPINMSIFVGLYHAIQWLLSPFNWLTVVEDTLLLVSRNNFLTFVGLLSFGVLLLGKKHAKPKLRDISEKVEKIYSDNFNYTLMELAYTLMLVLPLPLFIHFMGKFLSSHNYVANFTAAIGEGLLVTSIPFFFLQFFYRLFSPTGIARKHFQWPEETTTLLHRQIAWIRFVAVVGIFLIHCTGASKVAEHGDSLGRVALIIILVSVAVFFSRLLHPQRGLLKDYYHLNPDSWFYTLRYIWYSASFGVPLIILGFAVSGYYLSALELQQKLVITLRLIFLLVVIHAMVIRWLTLVNRQLATNNARQKRKAAALSDKPSAVGAEDPILPLDQQQIDIPKINVQTIKLLNVFIGFSLISGFWVIWKNILPAFSFLDDIVLWQHLSTVDNQESYQPITLTNLMLAGLYVFIVIVSIRNFYGVMELLVFRRWAIEPGSRYAANQLARYLLVTIGIVSVASELGGSWSQVQWLVAALSVGLGFGLQEIFANLVSGIILLFERPIRIGDVVTIGTVTGKVSRIEMRATTLIDTDQKDLIIPNKTFITSQLVNWTLSDAITRLVIPVGIAYHADVELAHQVMLDTVRTTPMVLADPEPSVLFIGFGESSLNFSIRIFVDELKNRLPVTHDLLMRLEKAFREHHIEIPMPQRDIHIRSMPKSVEKIDGITRNC